MAFARHNIEKNRLIGLVRVNPILWDCRLPHYKRSDKRKAIKWNELGRAFGVSGERVQRTFTSLREIFRRELNHEKLLGSRFKSKWEYFDSMAFLKEVIRERKSRERVKSDCLPLVNNGGPSGSIDEYQYFAPNDPNNPNNQQQQQQQQQRQQQQTQSGLDYPQTHSLPQALLSLQQPQDQPKLQQNHHQQQQQVQQGQDQPLQQQQQEQQQIPQLQQKISTNILQTQLASLQPQNKLAQPDIISSIFSASSSPSIYIKDEPDSQDETISASVAENDKQRNGCSRIKNSVVDTAAAIVSIPSMQPSVPSIQLSVSPTQPSAPPTTATEAATESTTKTWATTSSKIVSTEAAINCQQVSTTAGVGNNNNYKSNSDLNMSNNSKRNQYQTNNKYSHNSSKSTAIASKSYNIVDDVELLDGDCDDYDIDIDADDLDDIDDEGDGDDDIDDIMTPTPAAAAGINVGVGTGITNRRFSAATSATASSTVTTKPRRARRHRVSPREVLYNKFGDFLAARLNTLHETAANDLMNRILLLIAEK